jgi:hypothetical protein
MHFASLRSLNVDSWKIQGQSQGVISILNSDITSPTKHSGFEGQAELWIHFPQHKIKEAEGSQYALPALPWEEKRCRTKGFLLKRSPQKDAPALPQIAFVAKLFK